MAAGVEPRVTASANKIVADRHGLTHWDRVRQQYVKPPTQEESSGPVSEVEDTDTGGSSEETVKTADKGSGGSDEGSRAKPAPAVTSLDDLLK